MKRFVVLCLLFASVSYAEFYPAPNNSNGYVSWSYDVYINGEFHHPVNNYRVLSPGGFTFEQMSDPNFFFIFLWYEWYDMNDEVIERILAPAVDSGDFDGDGIPNSYDDDPANMLDFSNFEDFIEFISTDHDGDGLDFDDDPSPWDSLGDLDDDGLADGVDPDMDGDGFANVRDLDPTSPFAFGYPDEWEASTVTTASGDTLDGGSFRLLDSDGNSLMANENKHQWGSGISQGGETSSGGSGFGDGANGYEYASGGTDSESLDRIANSTESMRQGMSQHFDTSMSEVQKSIALNGQYSQSQLERLEEMGGYLHQGNAYLDDMKISLDDIANADDPVLDTTSLENTMTIIQQGSTATIETAVESQTTAIQNEYTTQNNILNDIKTSIDSPNDNSDVVDAIEDLGSDDGSSFVYSEGGDNMPDDPSADYTDHLDESSDPSFFQSTTDRLISAVTGFFTIEFPEIGMTSIYTINLPSFRSVTYPPMTIDLDMWPFISVLRDILVLVVIIATMFRAQKIIAGVFS